MALTLGDRGNSVRVLQQRLASAGFNPGSADGVFGQRTRQAVESFQRARGLRVDGQVGENTQLALRERNTDRFETRTPRPSQGDGTSRTSNGVDGFANITSTSRAGQRNQMVTGNLTVNGNTYTFRSGGHGRGSLPTGQYTVTAHMRSRNDRSMSVGGVGYSFAVSDKYDPRVRGTRTLLRIHPDGGSAGTEGCIGIVGDAATQRRFRSDMEAELRRNGGRYTLSVQ